MRTLTINLVRQNMKEFTYDVAISYASEDADYVSQVAYSLRANGVRVFYDKFEMAELWGTELFSHLEDIYMNKAQYVMIFISKSYENKMWTRFELVSALNATINRRINCILPVALDGTKLSGLPKSIAYISAQRLAPFDIAALFMRKLGQTIESNTVSELVLYRITRKEFVDDLTGVGAHRLGGRWNPIGTSMLYTSASIALSILSVIVHWRRTIAPSNYHIVKLFIPGTVNIDKIYESDLGKGWRDQQERTKVIGQTWAEERKSLILSVPNTVVPLERDYLVNPFHPSFTEIKIVNSEPLQWDSGVFSV